MTAAREKVKPERSYGCWPYTDEDKAIVAMRETKTLHETAAAFNVTVSHVLRSEWIARRDAEGREILAEDPENLRGLALIGEVGDGVVDVLHRGKLERVSAGVSLNFGTPPLLTPF